MGEFGAADKSWPVNHAVLCYSDVVCKKVPGLEPYPLAYVLVYFRLYCVIHFYISKLRDSLLQSALVVGLASHGPYSGAILPYS